MVGWKSRKDMLKRKRIGCTIIWAPIIVSNGGGIVSKSIGFG